MVRMDSCVFVEGVSGAEICDFMLHCTDRQYRAWWPGTHFSFHAVSRNPKEVGAEMLFDEMVGRRRITFSGVVSDYVRGKRIVWRMKWGILLPAWLVIELEDADEGVNLLHSLQVGWEGIGQVADPIWRLILDDGFEKDLADHARTEFPMLAKMLLSRRA